MKFQTSDVSICNGNKNNPVTTSVFTRNFAFQLFHVSIATANSKISKYCLYSLLFLPQAGKIWLKSDNVNYTKCGSFWQKLVYYVNHFWNIVSTILTEVLQVKQLMMLRVNHKSSIFHYPKNYGCLTIGIKFEVDLNMGDLKCLFETVCTLLKVNSTSKYSIFRTGKLG